MIPYLKEALCNLFKKPVTSKYPEGKIPTAEKYRGKIEFNNEVCIGCGMCTRVCSPGAITKTVKNIEGGQEITMKFDLGSCTFCAMCSDFCPKKAITLTDDAEIVVKDKKDLIVSGSFVKKTPPKPQLTPEQIKKIQEAKKAKEAAIAKKNDE